LLQFSLDFEAGTIIVNKGKLRPKVRTLGYVFVLHLEGKLGKKERVFLDKGGASDERSSIQEDF
jgi:hypothetical protein